MHIFYADAPGSMEPHCHNAHELIYVVSGRVKLSIASQTYTLGPDCAAFVNNLETHATEVQEAPYQRYFLTISAEELDIRVQNPSLASIFRQRPSRFCHMASFDSNQSILRSILGHMLKENARGDQFTAECLGYSLSLLLANMYRITPDAFPAYRQPVSEISDAVLHHINQHYREPVSIQALADALFVSVSWLSHTFRREVGISPQRYLLLTRLSAAREMLLGEGVSVSDAALHCGFSDASSFIKHFQKHYGVTPKQMQLRMSAQ